MTMLKTHKLAYRAISSGGCRPERQVNEPMIRDNRLVRRIGDPDWRDTYRPRQGEAYFATDYTLNTKYIVDAEAHSEIGSVVTLTTGKTVHVDLNVETINIRGNQR